MATLTAHKMQPDVSLESWEHLASSVDGAEELRKLYKEFNLLRMNLRESSARVRILKSNWRSYAIEVEKLCEIKRQITVVEEKIRVCKKFVFKNNKYLTNETLLNLKIDTL